MKKVTLFVSALTIVMLSSVATAADFHALSAVQPAPSPIQDEELFAIEGGAICQFQTAGGGLSVCDIIAAWPIVEVTSNAFFAADNGLAMSPGQFLQIQ
ncbi:MAG: hypothetical protein V3U75_11015 [Methylococcaceae bacterium]